MIDDDILDAETSLESFAKLILILDALTDKVRGLGISVMYVAEYQNQIDRTGVYHSNWTGSPLWVAGASQVIQDEAREAAQEFIEHFEREAADDDS